jgi:hypothetical protein
MKSMTVVFAAACLVAADVCRAASDVVLCERGKRAGVAIVYPVKSGPSFRYAADELQRCIAEMTGVKLAIAEDGAGKGGKAIRLTHTGKYGTDGFRLRVENGSLEISGSKSSVLSSGFTALPSRITCFTLIFFAASAATLSRMILPPSECPIRVIFSVFFAEMSFAVSSGTA